MAEPHTHKTYGPNYGLPMIVSHQSPIEISDDVKSSYSVTGTLTAYEFAIDVKNADWLQRFNFIPVKKESFVFAEDGIHIVQTINGLNVFNDVYDVTLTKVDEQEGKVWIYSNCSLFDYILIGGSDPAYYRPEKLCTSDSCGNGGYYGYQ